MLPSLPFGVTWELQCDWSTVNYTKFEFTLDQANSTFDWKRTDFDGGSFEEKESGTWTEDENHYYLNFVGKKPRQLALGKTKPLDFPFLLPGHNFSEMEGIRPIFVPDGHYDARVPIKKVEEAFWTDQLRAMGFII